MYIYHVFLLAEKFNLPFSGNFILVINHEVKQ